MPETDPDRLQPKKRPLHVQVSRRLGPSTATVQKKSDLSSKDCRDENSLSKVRRYNSCLINSFYQLAYVCSDQLIFILFITIKAL